MRNLIWDYTFDPVHVLQKKAADNRAIVKEKTKQRKKSFIIHDSIDTSAFQRDKTETIVKRLWFARPPTYKRNKISLISTVWANVFFWFSGFVYLWQRRDKICSKIDCTAWMTS